MKYETFTRRTNDPKLFWLECQLIGAGIECRRNGESFHAPILEVNAEKIDAAWDILNPVDDISDDDERYIKFWDENSDYPGEFEENEDYEHFM